MWKASYLVCTIKTVVHEPRNDGRFPDRLVAKENEFVFGQGVDLEFICAAAAHGVKDRLREQRRARRTLHEADFSLPSFLPKHEEGCRRGITYQLKFIASPRACDQRYGRKSSQH